MNINVQFEENAQILDVPFWEATVIHDTTTTYIDDLQQKNTIILNCGTSTTVTGDSDE